MSSAAPVLWPHEQWLSSVLVPSNGATSESLMGHRDRGDGPAHGPKPRRGSLQVGSSRISRYFP